MNAVNAAMPILLLFLLFQVKHFVCDYLLQTKYMLGKFKPYPDYILPLVQHSLVQTTGTAYILIIATFYGVNFGLWMFLGICLYDFVTHFVIDRLKASPNLLGRFKSDNKYFWWALGLDQLLHQVVYLIITATIISIS